LARAVATRFVDVPYHGQAYELTIPFEPEFPGRFHLEHEKAYGYAHGGRALELVNLRLRLTLPTPKPPAHRSARTAKQKLSKALATVRPVWFESREWETPFFEREKLAAGTQFSEPAVVLEYSSATVVPPDFICEVDRHRNLVLRLAG
jgi:N-methylhydantoinase A